MNILLLAKLSDKKLKSKLLPLVHLAEVKRVLLVRRYPLILEKVVCYCPPAWMQSSMVLSELYRFFKASHLCMRGSINMIIGMHFRFHGMMASILGTLFRKPTVLVFTEYPKRNEKNIFLTWAARHAKHVVVRGSRSQEYLNDLGVSNERMSILHNVMNLEVLPAQQAKEIDFIFVGNLIALKGIETFLQAIENMKETFPQMRCVILGSGPLRKSLELSIEQKGIDAIVTMNPYTANVRDWYAKSRVLVLPSSSEGLPMVVVEAMAQGLPCILTPVGDIQDIGVEGQNCMYVSPGDDVALERCMRQLLETPSLYSALSAGALEIRNRIPNEFSTQNIGLQWQRMLSNCTNSDEVLKSKLQPLKGEVK